MVNLKGEGMIINKYEALIFVNKKLTLHPRLIRVGSSSIPTLIH